MFCRWLICVVTMLWVTEFLVGGDTTIESNDERGREARVRLFGYDVDVNTPTNLPFVFRTESGTRSVKLNLLFPAEDGRRSIDVFLFEDPWEQTTLIPVKVQRTRSTEGGYGREAIMNVPIELLTNKFMYVGVGYGSTQDIDYLSESVPQAQVYERFYSIRLSSVPVRDEWLKAKNMPPPPTNYVRRAISTSVSRTIASGDVLSIRSYSQPKPVGDPVAICVTNSIVSTNAPPAAINGE